MERETAAAEQRRSKVEVFELKLQLEKERGTRSGIDGGEPWTAGSCVEPRGPMESAGRAVLLLEAAVSPT